MGATCTKKQICMNSYHYLEFEFTRVFYFVTLHAFKIFSKLNRKDLQDGTLKLKDTPFDWPKTFF